MSKHRMSKSPWNRNNKILLVLIIVQVVLLFAEVLFSDYLGFVLKLILSAISVSVSVSVISFTIRTYNRNSFDDKFNGVRLGIFIFTLIALFVSVAIFYW